MVLNQLVFRSYLAVNLLSCAQPIAERYSAHSAPIIIKRQMIGIECKIFYNYTLNSSIQNFIIINLELR